MSSLFAYALCACNELRLEGASFIVDSFDSRNGTYTRSQTGAAVGVNGLFTQQATDAQLFGSLFVVGPRPSSAVITGTKFVVAGDLVTNATLPASLAGSRFARDLWIDADILSPRRAITVGRDAYQAPGRNGIENIDAVGASDSSNDFSLSPPCACDAANVIDVPALVESARTQNDNVATGWSSDGNVESVMTAAASLPCGRLYIREIDQSTVSTVIIGTATRSALFVDGDIRVAALSTMFVGPGSGELDLFVRGDIAVEAGSTLFLGDNSRPASLAFQLCLARPLLGDVADDRDANRLSAKRRFAAAHVRNSRLAKQLSALPREDSRSSRPSASSISSELDSAASSASEPAAGRSGVESTEAVRPPVRAPSALAAGAASCATEARSTTRTSMARKRCSSVDIRADGMLTRGRPVKRGRHFSSSIIARSYSQE